MLRWALHLSLHWLQVVALTSKCGESSSPATQLQVVKALLTYATGGVRLLKRGGCSPARQQTALGAVEWARCCGCSWCPGIDVMFCLPLSAAAEHFMAHGDCLMQAVRTVFNIAIGSESPDIQNTARSALLQARLACMWDNAVCCACISPLRGRLVLGHLHLACMPTEVGSNSITSNNMNGRAADGQYGAQACQPADPGAACLLCCRARQAALCTALLAIDVPVGCFVAMQLLCTQFAVYYVPQSPHGTPLPSPSPTTFRPWRPTSSSDNVAAAGATSPAAAEPERTSSSAVSASSSAAVSAAASEADLAAAGAQGSDIALPSPSHPLSPAENDQLMEALSAELSVAAPVASCNSSPPEAAGPGHRSTSVGVDRTAGQPSSATSSSAGVAEAADVLAAAADIAELQAALPRIQTSPEGPAALPPLTVGGQAATSAEQFVAAAVEADARTAQLASLAEQADLRGLERALDSLPQAEPVGRPTVKLERQDTPPDPRRCAQGGQAVLEKFKWHALRYVQYGTCVCTACVVEASLNLS